jgi:hypothetical protein
VGDGAGRTPRTGAFRGTRDRSGPGDSHIIEHPTMSGVVRFVPLGALE